MINDASKPLIFLGTNKAIAIYIESCEAHGIEIAGIIDGDYFGNTESIDGVPVIDGHDAFTDQLKIKHYRDNYNFFCAVNWIPTKDQFDIRNTNKRKYFLELIEQHKLNLVSLSHPRASISPRASIGQGCYLGYCVVEPHVEISDFVSIWDFTIIGHHTKIGYNSTVQRGIGIAGDVHIKDNVYLAPYCYIGKSSIVIESGAWVQSGCVVFRNILPNEVIAMGKTDSRKIYSTYTPIE